MSIRISLNDEKYSEAIRVLEGIPAYWRSKYISDAILFYESSHNNVKKESDMVSKDTSSASRSAFPGLLGK